MNRITIPEIFKLKNQSSGLNRYLLAGLVVFFALFMIIQSSNGRFKLRDFEVYYGGANSLIHQEPVYGQAYGLSSGFFKYSPASAFFFIPLTALPFQAAKKIYYCLICFFIILLLNKLPFLIKDTLSMKKISAKQSSLFIPLVSFWIVLVHFYRELHLGNINVLLTGIIVFMSVQIIKKNQIRAGILFGLSILFKPYFLILSPLFLIRKQFKLMLVSSGILGAGFLLPSLIAGWSGNISMHNQWIRTMMSHNASSRVTANPNLLQSLLYHPVLKFLAPDSNGIRFLMVLGLTAGLFLFFLIRNFRLEKKVKNTEAGHFIIEIFLLISLIPNLVTTDTEHFLMSLPLIIFCLSVFYNKKAKPFLFLFIPACLFYGINWYDLWGRKISIWISRSGMLGMGNILLIITAVSLFLFADQSDKKAKRSSV